MTIKSKKIIKPGDTKPTKTPKKVNTVRKSLGRGLSALIPDGDMEFLSRVARGDNSTNIDIETEITKSSSDHPALKRDKVPPGKDISTSQVQWLPSNSIEANPFQPRRNFSAQEMEDLAQSIKQHGVLQPILVRPLTQPRDGIHYQIVAGERRWRATQQAQLETVPAIVRAVDDQQALELALIENIQRHDISALDAAHAYRRLADDFQLSQEQIAARVGKSRSGVANTMRLLELPVEMQKGVEDGKLTEGHGRALLSVAGDGARRALFRRILRDNLSVREAERFARAQAKVSKTQAIPSANDVQSLILTDAELKDLEQRLQRVLGTRLQIKPKHQGGQIILSYFSLDELDRLVDMLSKSVSTK